jgi:hypothetical protein
MTWRLGEARVAGLGDVAAEVRHGESCRDRERRPRRVKSYLKCGRAFRIETVINDAGDLGVARRLEHLEEILVKARDVNIGWSMLSVSVRAVSLRASL